MDEQNNDYGHFGQPTGAGFPPTGQQPQPKKKMGTGKKVALGIGALVIAGGIGSAIGAGASGSDSDEPATVAVEPGESSKTGTDLRSDTRTTTRSPSTAMKIPEPKKRDPLTSDGRYKVGTDIEPGVYEYTPRKSDMPGYFERCADIACEIGTPGFIQNDLVFGPGYLEILPTDAYIELSRLDLTPAGGA